MSKTWTHASSAERFERLPKWAQQEIETLRMRADEAEKDAARWKARLSNDTDEKTGVWLDGGWDKPNITLPKHARVSWSTPDGEVVTIHYDMNGRVSINTHRSLLIRPQATNVATVAVGD